MELQHCAGGSATRIIALYLALNATFTLNRLNRHSGRLAPVELTHMKIEPHRHSIRMIQGNLRALGDGTTPAAVLQMAAS